MLSPSIPDETLVRQDQKAGSLTGWSAAVINFNGGSLVSETVLSLKRQSLPPDLITVIDDHSTDGSPAIVRRDHPDVDVLFMEERCARPAPLRDRALQLAAQRHILITDNDVALAPDAVANLMAVMLRRQDAAACMGLVVAAEDHHLIRNQAHPLHYLCWSTADLPRRLEELTDRRERPGIGTGIQLLDVAKAREVGGFDHLAAFGWGDDAGIHHRLRLAGYQTLSVPDAIIYHHERRRKSRRIHGQVHNRLLILLTTYQTRTLVLAGPALILFEIILFGLLAASGHGRDYLRAVRDLAGKRSLIREQRRRTQTFRRVPDRDLLSAGLLDLPGGHGGSLVRRACIGALSRGFRWYWSAVRRLL